MVRLNSVLKRLHGITCLPDSSLTVQLHCLLTKAKMSGPKSVNLAKRDRLIEFTDAARNLPTLVISLNPRTGKQVAFIENGANKRKVQWMTLWDEVIHWCLTCVHNAKSSNVSLTRIDLPLWKEPKELGSEWWAWGLLQACRQYFETGNFLLKLLLLPPVLRDVSIGAFSNTGAIKPSWCLTSELLALCTSSGVNEWSGFNIRENHQKIMCKARTLCNFLVSGYSKYALISRPRHSPACISRH